MSKCYELCLFFSFFLLISWHRGWLSIHFRILCQSPFTSFNDASFLALTRRRLKDCWAVDRFGDTPGCWTLTLAHINTLGTFSNTSFLLSFIYSVESFKPSSIRRWSFHYSDSYGRLDANFIHFITYCIYVIFKQLIRLQLILFEYKSRACSRTS